MKISIPDSLLSALFTLLVIFCTGVAASSSANEAGTYADSQSTVECMVPGEIRSIAGHSTMGPRRPVQTSAADCRQRGGEYRVEPVAPPLPAPAIAAVDPNASKPVSCLLPRHVHQLGEKVRYKTARRSIRTTTSNCLAKGGTVIKWRHKVAKRTKRK
ncbi:MAG: hypothetical protein ABIQ97_02265 [Lysobacteraceae bacterium]